MTTAATVKSVQGEAFARSPTGGMRRLSAGDTIQQGEVVITSLGGQVSLATVDGQMINVNSQESFKFGPEAAQATAPQAGEAAVQPVVAQPGEIDVAQILEQDAAAAGLAGGGENGGNSFVRLMRITEGLTPLNYEFQNPAGTDLFQPEGLAIDGQPSAGDLVISLDEDDISEGEISTAWVGVFQASFAPGTNFDALYDIGNSDEARGDDVPDPSPTTLSGTLNFSYGSDGVGNIQFNLPTAALTSGGLPVQFWLAADGHTLVGYVMEAGSTGEDQESSASIKVIFSAEITDVASGAFSFALWGPLDHPDNTTEDNLVIPFGFTVTDSDGDAAVGTLTLNLDDDSPVWQSGESGEDGGVGAQVNEASMAYDDGDLSEGNDSGGSAYGAPAAGTYMAELTSSGSGNQSTIESFLGVSAGGLTPLAISGSGYDNATNGSAMMTTLSVNAGDQVSFSWAFDADDYLSFNDFAFVTINGQPTELSDISQVGSYGATPWATFTYTATSTGTLTLGFGVMNTGDSGVNSYLLVDKVQINGVDIPNGGFEAGNFSNWSTLGTANVVTFHDEIYGGGGSGDEASGLSGSLASLVSFGADGPGAFSLLSDISALPTLYSQGQMVGYSVAGNTLTATAGSGEDARVVFTLTVNADGSWYFDLTDQLDHVPGDGQNTALLTGFADYSGVTSVSGIDFSSIIRVTDGDGDELTGPPAGSFMITVQDDVPTLDVGLNSDGEDNQIEMPSLTTQDADTVGAASDTASASFAGLFTLNYSVGSDEPGTTPALSYALSVTAADGYTGLTNGGLAITLSMDGNDIVGSTTQYGDYSAAFTTPIFRISVDADGNVTLTQYAQIDHVDEGADNNAFNNDVNNLGLPEGAVVLTASALITDFDGDTASDSQSIDISGAISFDDDVPTVDVTGAALPTLTLDESPIGGGDGSGIVIKPQDLTNHNLANAIALDGHFTLGANSDVQNSETTPFVSIHATGNNAADYYAFTVTEAGSTAVFDIDYGMNQGGSFDPYIHLWNSAGVRIAANDDASTSLGEGGSIHGYDSYLTYTFAVPGTYYISVGKFPGSSNPDNPIPAGGTYQLQVSLTNAIMGGGDGVWTTSANFSGNFDGAYGADGPGNVAYALSLNGTAMGSGLYALGVDGAQGDEIGLSMDGNDIVGTIDDTEYFRISVNADTGEVTFTRYESIWHADTDNHDDASWLNAATGTLLMTATVTDFDGDSTSASLDLSAGVFSIEDDGPTAALAEGIEVVTPLVVDESDEDEGDGIREATADFTNYFAAPAYGADGPGSVSYALVLTGEGVGSGLYAVDADADDGQGDEILLYQEDDVIEGRVGDQVYFTISVDNDPESDTFGQVTFAQTVEEGVSVWHGNTDDHDDVESLMVAAGEGSIANSLQLVQTVTDADGDEARAALDLGNGVFQIEDDGPTADLRDGGDFAVTPLVVDESTVDDEETDEVEGDGIREATADFTNYFAAPAYGADGPGSVSYALVLTGEGVGSGLYAVDADADDGQGDEILLYQEGDVIEGRVGDQVYFTISVDNDPESDTFGQVTFAQTVEEGVSVWHGNTDDHDDVESLMVAAGEDDVANSLQLVQTVTDADGDEARAALDLGNGVFQIEDDGPTVTAPESAQGDYSFTATYQTVGYAGYNNSYGYYIKDADGNPTTGEVIWANVKTATGPVTVAGYAPEQVGFFIIPNGANKNTGLIDGDDITFQQVNGVWQAFKGTTALVGTGANIFFDKAALNVDGYSHVDDNSFPGNQNWEDLLGSTDSDYEDVNVNITWNGGLRVDESNFGIDAEMDLSGQFTVKPGADGLQSLTYALNVADGADSGLVDSLTGEAVLLRMNGTAVEGYAGDDVVFTLSVDEDGKVTLDQIRAVEHPTADPNEYVTLANANLITLTATATDNDGDTAFDTVNIGTLLHFADDRPLAVNDADGVKEDNNIVATGNVLTGVDVTGGDTNTTDGVADIAGADGGLSVTSLRTGAIGQWSTPTAMGSSGVSLAGTYGTLTLLANGNYSYALNNAATNVQSLKEGETKTDAFTYAMKDADGDSGTATLTITITGTNDAPVVTVGGGTVYEAALATGTTPSATTEVATGLVTISDVDNTFTGATGEVVVKTQGSNGNASVAWNANAGKWEWTYTLATAVDNDASGTNVEPGVDAFVITVDDGSGGVVDKTINISIVDDTPVFNSVMDAILSSATQVNFDGNYSASFGADGVDYLSAVLGTSGYVGTTAVTYQKSVYSSTVTHVDVMNGATKLFSFYYESTTNAVNAVGGNHDGSVVINAFGDPDNVAGTQFFTLAVKADGTYSFDMISNTILTTTSTTVSGGAFTAEGPSGSKSLPNGTLTIFGGDADPAIENVNASANGIGVGQVTISDGEWLVLDFLNQQSFISFKTVQWGGGGDVKVRMYVDNVQFDFNTGTTGLQDLDFAKPASQSAYPTMAVAVADTGHGAGTWGYNPTTYTYTLYVANVFSDVKIENVDVAGSNVKFGVNTITFDQTTTTTIQDMTMNFNLAVTDRDGDTSSLTDTLTVSMVNPDSTINATTITTGVDGNDGVVMVGNGDADTLVGGNGNDILIGDGGSDVLTGGAGSDTFKWELGDASVAGTVDHITDFNLVPKASGGDVLDLTDLLSGETNTALSLDAYLNFSAGTGADAGRAVITVDVDGSGAGTTGQAIVLDNITYTQLQSYAGGAGSDVDIINKLLTDGNLKVTGSP